MDLAPLPYLLCPKQGVFVNNAEFWAEEARGEGNLKASW